MPFSFGDDGGGFGEFNFFVSSSSSPQQHHPLHHNHQQQQQQQDRDDDDDWGDFVQSPHTNSIPPSSSSSPHSNGKWEKPTGAIPLSIFGDEEEESTEPTQLLFNNVNNNGFSSPSPLKPLAIDVKDLISDLYAQPSPPPPANASTSSDLPKAKDRCEDGDVDDDDDNSWEFKDAFSPIKGGGNGNGVQGSGDWFISSQGDLLTSTSAREEFSESYRTLNGSFSGLNSSQTEIMAFGPAVAYLNSECQIDNGLSYYSTPITCLDFYHRLKEESIFFIIRHLGDLKKSHEVAGLSGKEAKILKSKEDIQAVYKVLQEAKISEDDYMEKHSSKGSCVNLLVEVTKEPYFRALEEEYRLSARILSAEKELRASIELFGHASSVIRILRLASTGDQQAYISAWSRMARACTKELQHGTMIWKESLDANISKEILSLGSRYFAALVEIYRVTEILRASLKLYKPWILSNPEDCSREVVSYLTRCAELWATLGVENTLESCISAATTDCKVKLPVKSKLLCDLDELSFQNHAFDRDNVVCKLSLLPVDKLEDMKTVTWNGDHYCLILANFWANRVSCNPPQLPRIPAS